MQELEDLKLDLMLVAKKGVRVGLLLGASLLLAKMPLLSSLGLSEDKLVLGGLILLESLRNALKFELSKRLSEGHLLLRLL